MKDKPYIMTLCFKCRADFEIAGENHIRRVDRKKEMTEKCDYCSFRLGCDYEIIPKDRRRSSHEE